MVELVDLVQEIEAPVCAEDSSNGLHLEEKIAKKSPVEDGKNFKFKNTEDQEKDKNSDRHEENVDTYQFQPNDTSPASPMLEPATRLISAGNNIFTGASPLRRSPSDPPSPGLVQPNRSLPLRPAPPAPRRKSATLILCPPPTLVKLDHPKDDALDQKVLQQENLNDGERNIQNGHVSEKSELEQHQQRPSLSPSEDHPPPEPSPSPVRNGVIDSPGNDSPRLRIIENVRVSSPQSGEVEAPQQEPAKEPEHPQKQPQQQQQPQPEQLHHQEQPHHQSQLQQHLQQSHHHHHHQQQQKQQQQQQQQITNYCIVAAPDKLDCTPKSIEIMIPSVPELGIKETRTDRISVSQDSSQPNPYIQYIITKDPQYPGQGLVPVMQIPVMGPAPLKNPDPGGQTSPGRNSTSNLSRKSDDGQSSLSMPVITGEETEDLFIVENGEKMNDSVDQQRHEWLERRKILRENFLDLRNQAYETRKKLIHNLSLVPEDSPQRVEFPGMIENCNRQIEHYANLLGKLNAANSLAKLGRLCEEDGIRMPEEKRPAVEIRRTPSVDQKSYDDAQLLGLTSSGAVEIRRVYGPPVSEPQNFEKQRTNAELKTQSMPNVVEFTDAVNLNRKIQPQMNGYSSIPRELEAYNEGRRGKSVETRNFVVDTQNHPSKSVIVEPILRPAPSSPPTSKAPMRYSSFLIDELAAPATAVQVRPYPLHSREGAVQGARAPPNSPREALVATSVPDHHWVPTSGAETYHQHHPGTTLTDLANGHHHQHPHHQHCQDEQTGDRRPLDLAIKGNKRPMTQEELIHQQAKDERRKRRRVSDMASYWANSQTQAQQQQATLKARTTSYSGHPRETHYYQSSQFYAYLQQQQTQQHQEPALWNPAAGIQQPARRPIQHYPGTLDYRSMEKSAGEYKQISPADYVLAVHRMHEDNALPSEQAKSRDSPIPIIKPSVHKIDVQTSKSQQQPIEATQQGAPKPGVVISANPMAGTDRSAPPMDARQAYYQQQPAQSAYKQTASAAPTMKNILPKPMTGMWPPGLSAQQELQQQRTLQASRHHQSSFYPPIATAGGLSYSKYPKDIYQTPITLNYNPAAVANYPYSQTIPYRLASEQIGLNHQPQRVPPLIPMETPEKRLQPGQRYELAPPGYATEYGRRVSLDQYPQQVEQQQYSRLQQQGVKVSTSELSRVVSQGRQYKNSNIYVHSVPPSVPVSRNGTVVGSSSSAPTSIYSNGTSPHHSIIPPRPVQSAEPRTSPNASSAPKLVAPYEHDRPNLGVVNRSPNSGVQTPRCANCGTTGARFECLGCETAVYCNETCQTQHWILHVPRCSVVMPRLKKVG